MKSNVERIKPCPKPLPSSQISTVKRGLLVPFFVLVLGISSLSLSGARAESKNPSSFSAADKEFVMTAAQGGMTEVALGKLAAEKGTTAEVRDFGKMMVKDHSQINSDVKALAKKKGLELPTALDEKHQAKVDKMSKLSGTEFDQAYLAGMAKMHQKDLTTFTTAKASTTDTDLKATLDKAIPIVKSHIDHLKNMPSKS